MQKGLLGCLCGKEVVSGIKPERGLWEGAAARDEAGEA
jgi:hypothetical protein